MTTRQARRSGGPLAASRSKRRGPRDQREVGEDEAFDFDAVIEAWLDQDDRREHLHALDLRAFVRECGHPKLGPGQRLRKLAVYLDTKVNTHRRSALQEWELFARIYDEAERLAPEDSWVLHSRAITAVDLGWWRSDTGPEAEARARLLADALASVARGLALDPEDPELHYLSGYVRYMHGAEQLEAALAGCERALTLKPNHPMATLYRAHCLHDLERWAEAVEAYAVVQGRTFRRNSAWRRELAREQRAFCLWRSGAIAEALAEFESLLDEREAAVAAGDDHEWSPRLRASPTYMALAFLSPDFEPHWLERLRAHLEAIDRPWVLERAKRERDASKPSKTDA